MQLRLKIRQAIQYQVATYTAGYYSGNNPSDLSFNIGTLPVIRQWPGYGNFIDITDYVSNLSALKLTWTTERDISGSVTPGVTQQKKSASGSITFEGDAFRYLKSWLIDDVSAPLNSVDVQIEHVGCGIYENYAIKSTDLQWCEGAVCTFDVTLKQKDEPTACIMRTLIGQDAGNGWFTEGNGSVKKHPRFSYCSEIRPNGMMVVQWFNMAVFTMFLITFVAPLILAWNSLVAIIKAIIKVVNTVGGHISTKMNYITFGDLKDAWGPQFVESAGCGREHPAPLIRDYISNVCSICGINVDETTADIFFAKSITIQTSDKNRAGSNNGVITVENPHYNACYLFPQTKRGIRRFGNFGFSALFGHTEPNTTDYWIQDNAPLLALDMFLDQLAGLYNAGWMIKSINQGGQLVPHLYFKRKDFFTEGPGNYIFDFTENGTDRPKILQGICYDWNGKTTPAYCEGIYAKDALDPCGNEACSQMNDIVSFGDIDNNPTFGGFLDKTVQFGATKFRLDGASTDYVFDAMQVVVNAQLLTGFMFGFMRDFVYPFIQQYADYALLMKDETCTLPKVLIWDGESYDNARCKAFYYGHSVAGTEPPINPVYNSGHQLWSDKHKINNFVIGSNLSLAKAKANPTGRYKVQSLGATVADQPSRVINYPMSFDTGYYDTLWDWFHWIDDPKLKPVLNQNWTVKIDLCCDDLQAQDNAGNRRLGVFNNASQIALGEKVKMPMQYYPEGIITEITISYDTSDTYGQYIELKGTV